MTVAAGGFLELVNATIVMNSTYEGQYHVEVLPGGTTVIRDWDGDPATSADRSLVTAGQTGNVGSFDSYFHYYFWVRAGARFEVRNSEIHEVGSVGGEPDRAGVRIWADDVIIENATLADTGFALTVTANNSRIAYSRFHNAYYWLSGSGRNWTILNNTVNRTGGLIDRVSDFVFRGNRLIGDGFVNGLGLSSCTIRCDLSENVYENWGIGLEIWDSSNVTISRERFTNPGGIQGALRIDRSQGVRATGLDITGGGDGLRFFIATNVTISESSVQVAQRSFWADQWSDIKLENVTLANTSAYSVLLDHKSRLTTLNTTFNASAISFLDTPTYWPSELIVKWFMDVKTEDQAGRPVPGAVVDIRNSTGSPEAAGATDGTGWLRWLPVTSYVQRDLNLDGDGTDPGEIVPATPHNVTATSLGMTAYAVPPPAMDRSKAVVVRFPAALITYTVNRTPAEGSVTVDGQTRTTPASFSWFSGTTHTVEAPSVDAVGPGERFLFRAWGDGGSRVHTVVAPPADATLTASYVRQFQPAVSISGNDGRPVAVTYLSGGALTTGSATSAFSDWVDAGTPLSFAALADGSSSSERWMTLEDFARPPWSSVSAPFIAALQYQHQFSLQVRVTGIAPAQTTLSYVSFGTPSSPSVSDRFAGWADAGTTASVLGTVVVSPAERFRTTDGTTWTITAPVDAAVAYRHQFSHSVTLDGTDAAHPVHVTYALDGVSRAESPVNGSWQGWTDTGTLLEFPDRTEGTPARVTEDAHSWTVAASVVATIRYREPQSPPGGSPNFKPALAGVLSAVLALATVILRRRTPYLVKKRTLVFWGLGGVGLEIATGVISFATGVLSVPPVIGLGTLVDLGIFAGALVGSLVLSRKPA